VFCSQSDVVRALLAMVPAQLGDCASSEDTFSVIEMLQQCSPTASERAQLEALQPDESTSPTVKTKQPMPVCLQKLKPASDAAYSWPEWTASFCS
jgi:hypothetical protein